MDYSLPSSSVYGMLRQEYWSVLPCPPPGDLPHPGIESTSLASPALADGSLSLAPPGKPTTHPETVIKNVNEPEGWYGEGGGRRIQDGEHMYTCGGFILIFGKTNTIM